MDATLEDVLTSWFLAEQEARSAPWSGMLGEQRRAEHARALIKLQTSTDNLFIAAAQHSTALSDAAKKKSKRA